MHLFSSDTTTVRNKAMNCDHKTTREEIKEKYVVPLVGTITTTAKKCVQCGYTVAIKKDVQVRIGPAIP